MAEVAIAASVIEGFKARRSLYGVTYTWTDSTDTEREAIFLTAQAEPIESFEGEFGGGEAYIITVLTSDLTETPRRSTLLTEKGTSNKVRVAGAPKVRPGWPLTEIPVIAAQG